jgi:DNA-binding response OmpR family regulator
MSAKLMAVDDDPTLLRFLTQYLERDGFEVITAEDGPTALKLFYEQRPELLILDIMMPGMDGWELSARIRELANVPIILLTAKSTESDKLRGFRLGVDDFVVKPFSLAELAARVRAVLKRSQAEKDDEAEIRVGILYMDLRRHEVQLGVDSLTLTPTEFRLLEVLARRQGEAVSQKVLREEVWGPNYDPRGGALRVWGPNYDPRGGALRRFIWLLRQKLERDPQMPERIVTVRGYGYRLEPEAF